MDVSQTESGNPWDVSPAEMVLVLSVKQTACFTMPSPHTLHYLRKQAHQLLQTLAATSVTDFANDFEHSTIEDLKKSWDESGPCSNETYPYLRYLLHGYGKCYLQQGR